MKKISIALVAVLILSTALLSCNAFDLMDNPTTHRDNYAAAIAKANEGDCVGAKDLLINIQPPTDNVRVALGWAYLCIGGATAGNIASSIYKYTGANSDYTVVGTLARTMLPMDGNKTVALANAIEIFSAITDSRRDIELAIAKFSHAASILANQAGSAENLNQLEKSDVSSSCSDSCTTCAGAMSDADVLLFSNSIADAASLLQSAGANDLQGLAAAIQTGLGATSAAGRCFIYKSTIPAS